MNILLVLCFLQLIIGLMSTGNMAQVNIIIGSIGVFIAVAASAILEELRKGPRP